MGFLAKERKDICLLGSGSAELERAFSHRRLRLIDTNLDTALRQCAGAVRAILSISTPLELAKILVRGLRPSLEHGVMFAAIDRDKAGFAQVQQLCGPDHIGHLLSIAPSEAALLPIRAFADQVDWEQEAAQSCAEHDPGRSASAECEVEYTNGDDQAPDSEDLVLIKRAFSDYGNVKLTYLSGGQSRARGPWMVDALDPNGRSPVKVVFKTGRIDEISREIYAMQTACFNRIPFRHYPPLLADRCLTGATKRAIVSMLVEDAKPLEAWIATPKGVVKIRDIYNGPLRLWRKEIAREPVAIGAFCLERNVVPAQDHQLKNIWKQARKIEAGVLRYDELYSRFIAQPKIAVSRVDAHGDLHLRNILVHDRTEDVLLIDFSNCGEAPASYDPATLDVSLGFDIPADAPVHSRPTEAHLLEFYSTPLMDRPAPKDASARIAAASEVRRQVFKDVSEEEYRLAIAGCLIWQAWKRRSTTAYRCASHIVATLN